MEAAAAAVDSVVDAAADLIVIDEAEASLPAVAAAAAGPEAALPAAAAGSDPPILWEDDDRLAPYTVVEREGAIYKYYVIVEHPTDNTKLLAFCKLLPIKLDSRKRDIATTGTTEVKEYNFGKKLPFLHLTSDFWTAKHQNKAYGTVVVAFVNNQWELCIRTLGTCYMGGTKTADRLARWVAFVLRKATGLKMDSVVSCTSDGASDMK
ncbi:hypothetical protein JKP88DRAFT_337158 [Tribonema minus]|uniref:Uncharacterized protein n=1 Tax=Tribonema minus TaxID=303371 RepID=A0A836C924_9STRA|nr:hypothetical protein JKP88DRAFT_337158 [Tribonema minus]